MALIQVQGDALGSFHDNIESFSQQQGQIFLFQDSRILEAKPPPFITLFLE